MECVQVNSTFIFHGFLSELDHSLSRYLDVLLDLTKRQEPGIC